MSDPFIYVEHKVNTALRFQVLGFNAETGMGKLRSSLGIDFERLITKDELDKRNYRLRKSATELPMGDWPVNAPLATYKNDPGGKAPPPKKLSTEEHAAALARNSAVIQGTPKPVTDAFGSDDEDE
jgi:hypothetical protein